MKKQDIESKFLNLTCINPCIFIKDYNNNIIKYQTCHELFKWESLVYIEFVDKQIFPLIDLDLSKNQIVYMTNNLVSLRSFLEKKSNNNLVKINLLINELFCFINKCKNNNFIHGNLQIDNIYLDIKDYTKFYLIDYTNSFILNNSKSPNFKRSSFISEYETKNNDKYFSYWDFFTIYVSLKNYFYCNKDILLILEKNIDSYINFHILSKMITKYIYT